jgi:tRNA dimethylallyltransferase
MSSGNASSLPSEGKPWLIVIVGPTGGGKSEIAVRLAERMGAEIVSADSRLFYRGMDIGTAKPGAGDRRRVPHHLIDMAGPAETWSLALFQKAAAEAIAGIRARGRLPFLVGGTGQYIRAVTEGWTPPEARPDPRLRRALEAQAAARGPSGPSWLHERLAALDPPAAQSIDPRNLRRTIRALEVLLTTGRRFSDQRSRTSSPYRLLMVGLTRPRPELYARIDARIESMFTAGLLDEVRALLDKGCSPDLPAMSSIGYRECVGVLEGRMSVEQAKVQMRRLTRLFVRRQANWFRLDYPAIHWFTVREGIVDDIQAWLQDQLSR